MKYTFTFLLAFMCLIASGQSMDSQTRFISVNGSAETEVTPNIIVLSVRLTEYEKDKKLVAMESIERGFLAAIKNSRIDEDDVVVSQVSSNAFNTKRKRKAFASKTYELTFEDQKGLLDFTGRLENLDIDHMYISKLSHTDLSELRLEVKKEALKAAQHKARELVEVVGAVLGDVLSIQEGANNIYTPAVRELSNVNFRYSSRQENNTVDDIGFKKIKLRFEISARFEIK